MNIKIREYRKEDIFQSIKIWNEIVEGGIAFPQIDTLDDISGDEFFKSQSFTGIAFDSDSGEIAGALYSTSKQCGKMRSYLQCKLCSEIGQAWISHRRIIGEALYGNGKRAGI